MPEPYIQLREIDRKIADFNSKEVDIKQQEDALRRRLQDIELAKSLTPERSKVMSAELAGIQQKLVSMTALLNEVNSYQEELEKQLRLIPAKIDKAIKLKLSKHPGLSDKQRGLAEIQLRKRYELQFQASKINYNAKLFELRQKAGLLHTATSKLSEKATVLKRMLDAGRAQAPVFQPNTRDPLVPSTNPASVETRLKQLESDKAKLNRERAQFNSRDGKDGFKAKLRLQSNIMDKVNNALRSVGFVDPLSPLERTAKSIAELEGTERTFLLRQARDNKHKLMSAPDVYDLVRHKIFDGDASHALLSEIDKITDALAALIESREAQTSAAIWWKSHALAKPHLTNISALLSAKLRFRFRGSYKTDLDSWIKTNLS